MDRGRAAGNAAPHGALAVCDCRTAWLLSFLATFAMLAVLAFLSWAPAAADGVSFTQAHYRWYDNWYFITPTTPKAAVDNPFSGASLATQYRLRMNVQVTGGTVATDSQAFKLQYATSTSGPWTDVGNAGAAVAWRGYDNPIVIDQSTVDTLLLTGTSTVGENYQENNPSHANSRAIPSGGFGEWDWVLQDYAAASGATYFFRMVKSDGTPFTTYATYPELVTAPGPLLTQTDYRWYENMDSAQPITPLEEMNTAISGAAAGTAYHLRMNLAVSNANLAANTLEFKLQYSASTSGPWTDVAPPGGSTTWIGYDNSAATDGQSVTVKLTGSSNVGESYEESNPSRATRNQAVVGEKAEYGWVVRDNNAVSNTTYYFRMVLNTGQALLGYTNYPAITAAPPNLSQNTYRWYANADAMTPGAALAAENAGVTGASSGSVYRLRISVASADSATAARSTYKLQFATSTSGPWTDVGTPASSEVWRTYNNPSPVSGTALTSVLLSTSSVVQTYQESNPSAGTPNLGVTGVGNDSEWDWALTPVNAASDTQYYFRMMKGDGSALNAYTNYPSITTAPAALSQAHYRWYDNADAVEPATALAAQDSLDPGATDGSAYHLRIALTARAPVPAGETFKLQYATSAAGPWTDVGAPGSAAIWRGVDNATPADGAALTSALLTGVTALQTYEENNPSAVAPNAMSYENGGEWAWTVQNNGAAVATLYFFRMALADDTPLAAYDVYPRLYAIAVGTPVVAQDSYQWYQNADFLTPVSQIEDERTPAIDGTSGTAYRMRMNLAVVGAEFPAGAAFKLQFATSETGPWTDVGGTGSGVVWRAYDNATPADGATLTTLVLGESSVAGFYEEANPSAATPSAIAVNNRVEFDWVVQNNLAPGETTYLFRMVKDDDAALDVYNMYPTITTASAKVNQSNYKWFNNADSVQPGTPLGAQDASIAGVTDQQVIRMRLGLAGSDSPVPAGRSFKVQYATSQSGPWTDVGAIGSVTIWRLYDNPTPADGAPVTTNLLVGATLLGTYEEVSPTDATATTIVPGAAIEYD